MIYEIYKISENQIALLPKKGKTIIFCILSNNK